MPNCYTLCPKDNPQERAILQEVDDKMREHFGADSDKENWYLNWHNTVGLCLSLGKNWNEVRESFEPDSPLHPVIDWLEENYIPNSWYQPR